MPKILGAHFERINYLVQLLIYLGKTGNIPFSILLVIDLEKIGQEREEIILNADYHLIDWIIIILVIMPSDEIIQVPFMYRYARCCSGVKRFKIKRTEC